MAERSRRDEILEAAGRIVAEQGGGALTLDAAAKAAGVSKGGLLYHFPTKEALIAGMFKAYLAQFEALLAEEEAADRGPERGRWLRAYVRASFAAPPPELPLVSALLAAQGVDVALLDRFRQAHAAWQARALADSVPPAAARLALAAVDGVVYAELFGLGAASGEERAALLEAILQRIDQMPECGDARECTDRYEI